MVKIFYVLLITIYMFNYSYTCSSDQIRDIMINSCNILQLSESKLLKLVNSFDHSLCCTTDSNILAICARYFCY